MGKKIKQVKEKIGLIESLAALIAIIIALLFITKVFSNDRAQANNAQKRLELSIINSAIINYHAASGKYPTQQQISDISWAGTNLGLEPESFSDSSGRAINQPDSDYTYQTFRGIDACDVAEVCENYRLTAGLAGDQSAYSLSNLY